MTIQYQIKACLFDMDGLLINSEDMYTQVTNEVLKEHGKGPLPWEVKIELQGRPGPAAAAKFLEWSQLPYTPEELFAKTSLKQRELWPTVEFMPGALDLLQHLKAKNIPIALATSSHFENYQMKTAHLRHGFDLFGTHVVVGNDPRVPVGRGKPAPDIFLTALQSINDERKEQNLEEILPQECLVFEDGMLGVVAGKAAGCKVVWVPDVRALEVIPKETIDELIDMGNDTNDTHDLLPSLTAFDKSKYGLDL